MIKGRLRWTLVGLLVGLALTGLLVMTSDPPDPYAALRQTARQGIPGALGYELVPPPADARPGLTPQEVRRRYPADGG
ncbi:MAG TPA: hypothetical protein VFP13_06990, partial [Actinomycetota bacterium]|nr:hypothetical protein [Actinomycetota bacterium]